MDRARKPFMATALVLVGWACSPSTRSGVLPPEGPVSVGTLSLEIGDLAGDPSYMFQDISDAVRLASGALVVVDRGTSEVTVYSRAGQFERRFGGAGQGPGLFQGAASSAYPMPGDSVMVSDMWTETLSMFGPGGEFAYQLDQAELAVDSIFALDTWITGRYLIRADLGDESRRRANALISRLPSPAADSRYRLVHVGTDGRMWMLEETGASTHRWLGIDPAEGSMTWLDLPGEFTPFHFERNRVLGRATDSLDVHYVHEYVMEPTGATRPAPEWLTDPRDAATAHTARIEEDDFANDLSRSIRALARSQEIHYSHSLTYTTSLDSLDWPRADIDVDFVEAGPRGWFALFTRPGTGRMCGMGYGFTMPAGWRAGQLSCAAPATTAVDGQLAQ